MKKRFSGLIFLLVLCWSVLPAKAEAVTPLDPERKCSMTLYYTQDATGFPNLEIQVYRVAEAFPNGTYDLILPFSDYPVNIYGITSQTEWKDVATTLTSYIAANGVKPDRTAKTAADGTVVFSGLETGLYLIQGVTAENDNGIYRFDDFMMYLPTPGEGGDFDYDMEAKPKCSSFIPKTEYKIVKLWKDAGYSKERPKSVSIDILKDGSLYETVTLNSANNWSYSWKVSSDDTGKWTVAERDVSEEYKVTISEKSAVFTITNTRKAPAGQPPKTGDTFAFWPWILTMCLSGSLLLIISVYHKRKK